VPATTLGGHKAPPLRWRRDSRDPRVGAAEGGRHECLGPYTLPRPHTSQTTGAQWRTDCSCLIWGHLRDTVANEIMEFEVVELQPFSSIQMLFATQEQA
jgi:hypothetical protein